MGAPESSLLCYQDSTPGLTIHSSFPSVNPSLQPSAHILGPLCMHILAPGLYFYDSISGRLRPETAFFFFFHKMKNILLFNIPYSGPLYKEKNLSVLIFVLYKYQHYHIWKWWRLLLCWEWEERGWSNMSWLTPAIGRVQAGGSGWREGKETDHILEFS